MTGSKVELMVSTLQELPDKSHYSLMLNVLNNPTTYPNNALANICTEAGWEMSEAAVRRWRKKHVS